MREDTLEATTRATIVNSNLKITMVKKIRPIHTQQTKDCGVNLSHDDEIFNKDRCWWAEKQSKGVSLVLFDNNLPTKEA